MIQLNRLTAPDRKIIKNLSLPELIQVKLDNNIDLYLLEGGSQDVTKIDIYFPSGLVQAGKPLLASTTNNMLEEGTMSRSSAQISELFDYYGAYLGTNTSYHYSMVSLVTLTKYLDETLPLTAEIIRNPLFPDTELKIYLNKKRQEFLLDQEKVKMLASRKFNEILFGEDHPYGMNVQLPMFNSIHRDDLINFHQQYYSPKNCQIIVSGRPGKNYLSLLNSYLGNKNWESSSAIEVPFPDIKGSSKKKYSIEKMGALQAALRIGKPIITKDHKDFKGLQVLNTILGGYFSSRLMTTIREEKGYTYGISSYLASLKNSGFWVIATEVKNDVKEDAIGAIFVEMEKLRTTLIGPDELEIVKNFMLGDLLRNLDSPFSISDNIKGLLENNLDLSFYTQMVQVINEITPESILNLAQKYLQPDSFYTVIAG